VVELQGKEHVKLLKTALEENEYDPIFDSETDKTMI
jgi:hypothetical protein